MSFADYGRHVFKSAVSFFLSSVRIHVEQAFGILGKHWGIYKAGLNNSLDFVTEVIECSISLHSWLIENVFDVDVFEYYTTDDAGRAWVK